MTRHSIIAKEASRKRYEELRIEKKKEIDDFQANCEDGTVAFHISFDKFDADKSGAIDVEELEGAMFHMGLEVPPDKVQGMLNKFDNDNNGELDFEEFKVSE